MPIVNRECYRRILQMGSSWSISVGRVRTSSGNFLPDAWCEFCHEEIYFTRDEVMPLDTDQETEARHPSTNCGRPVTPPPTSFEPPTSKANRHAEDAEKPRGSRASGAARLKPPGPRTARKKPF